MEANKLSRMRILARLSCKVAWELDAKRKAEALRKLKRFIERNVDTEEKDSLTLSDIGDFDIGDFKIEGNDFHCLVNDVIHEGDFSIHASSEDEAFAEEIRVFCNNEEVKDELLIEKIEEKLNAHAYENAYELYMERLIGEAESRGESQEER